MYIDRKNNYFNIVQYRLKTIKLNIRIKKVELSTNIRGMISFSHYLVMESLTLLEFLTNKHAAVNSFKQKYKTVNIQLKTDLQDDNLLYFLNIIKIFYLPAYKRQNFWFLLSEIFSSKFIFNIAHPTLIPFLPNTYFKWKCLINIVFFFNKNNIAEIILFLNYLGFYFIDEEDFFLSVLDLNKDIINKKIKKKKVWYRLYKIIYKKLMLPWDFKEIIDSILILCQNYKKIDPTFLQWFLRRADGMFPYSAAVNNSKIIEYIDLISLKNNKYVNSMFSTESFTLSTTNKKKLKIKRVDWSIYPYHILYTPPRLLEFIRYFTDLYSNFVDKHLKIFTSPILLKYVNFSMITEKVFLSEIFSSLEWKKSTIIIRGKPCLSKVITREITDFDLYVKNFKYSPIDLNKFIFVNNTINSIYYDCYGNQFTFHNYFETAHWFITHSKYFLHSRDVINVNNFKIWSKFYPRGISTTEAFVSFIDFQDFNKYFKNIISSSFDFSNSQYIFKRENDKFQYLFSFSNTFDNFEKSNLKLGFFLSYKMDFHLFRFLSSFFFLSIFENSFLSDWVTSLYFHVAKDLIITSKSDFNILYKTTASWNNYRELNLSANGKWFLESKIVNQKIIYDWKWKNNFNTFVPIDQYKVQHFVPGKNFSEIKINTLRDSVSHKIDKKILNEIFILNKLIEEKIPKEESEAIRIMWEDYRRYRTCRFWRHFPHHAAYVEKYFTDPKTRKK